ncbi:MATE family efflux transporter [Desulfosarcina widdelii]|uniref:Multidrug-efflux transporter n=1 Tax=Desulfosarcina widdelii TaxID=947919 RepID=A0A5K7Z2V9_9BACT|nr:MATE family efflux transporter [Desulfosarcina widdelii]BBO75045.1 MATE family efflux transporter [Desulfosarcina widdelii]
MRQHLNRYRQLFSVSLPLVLSMAAVTVMEFTDRVFLANYDIDAIAAATPAGVASFLILTIFTGITGYLNIFIAQYTGAGAHHRIGPCIWQGLYVALLSAVLLACISFFAGPLFRLGGHAPEVQLLERQYFRILCLGGSIHVAGIVLSCFFSGRGRTRPVMIITIIGMLFNIPLDYALINGVGMFPEMGIRGAGIATVSAWTLITLLYAWMIFNKTNDRQYHLLSSRRMDRELLGRILRKGAPASLQFTMDVFSFAFFIFAVGRLGKVELAVSNIAFSLESVAFMPAVGFSLGLSTLVGQSLGRDDVQSALDFTRQTVIVLMAYIACLVAVFLFAPGPVLGLFLSPEQGQLLEQGTVVLRIMALFIVFDALYFTFLGVLKGAGDTGFIMWSVGVTTLLVMIVPLTVIIAYLHMGLVACWITLTLYVLSLFAVSFWRFRQGKWKRIRVI